MISPFHCFYRLLLLIFLLSLNACMVGPDFCSPPAPIVDGYTETPMPNKTASAKVEGGHSQRFDWGENLENVVCSQEFPWGRDFAAEWWKLFHSKELNELVSRGIVYNPNVQAAQAALRVARYNYLAGVGALFPSVSLQALAQRQRIPGGNDSVTITQDTSQDGSDNSNNNTSENISSNQASTFSLYNVSVNVSYVLDVFGGIRRNIESLCALVDYQRFILEGTYLSLTANIVTAAITEASLRDQIKATKDLIALQTEVLKITKTQFELGGASKPEVLAQETQLAQTIATLPPLEQQLAQARHSLAALVGEFPSNSCLPIFTLENLHLPRRLPVSLPSRLVRQRPDIRAQEALMHQASALIGVATANMLPQITLNANYGYEGTKLSDLFKPSNVAWSYGAQLFQPIFQGGTLNARRCAAIALYEQVDAQYRETVLQAFQNVADSLRAIENDARALEAQRTAELAATENLNLTNQQYKLGAINYLLLLVAQRDYHLSRIERIRAQAARYADTVALFQALGGGWWNCYE